MSAVLASTPTPWSSKSNRRHDAFTGFAANRGPYLASARRTRPPAIPNNEQMTTVPHHASGLPKATWTDDDFDTMGWHDCRVHALSITDCLDDALPPHRLFLDLDYIVRWVEPERRRGHFTFWVAPSTLVFDGAWSIDGTLGPLDYGFEIAEVHRLDSPDGHADPLWRIEGHNFELRLRAAGYTQYTRLPPQHLARQDLSLIEREGVGFAERSFV